MRIARGLFTLVLLAGIGWASFGLGQEPAKFAGNNVTSLIKVDLTGVSNKQVIANIYEVPAGAMVPRHFHHGDEFHLVYPANGRPKFKINQGI
jgi:hypothetical protein